MKKFLFKLFIIILVLLILSAAFVFLIGYGYYSNTLHKKSLTQCVEAITSKEHFVKYEELSKKYVDAVIAVEDHRFYDHGPVDFIAVARALYTNIRDKEFDEDAYTPGDEAVSKEIADVSGYLTEYNDGVSFDYVEDGKLIEIFAPDEETLSSLLESSNK